MNIAVIPARKGSKRIRNKNIVDFYGIPMIAHGIKLALESKIFDHVLVSTDCEKIKEISLFYGAEVPWLRPKSLATDETSTAEVMKHATENIMSVYPNVKNICCIYPGTPLLKIEMLILAKEMLSNPDCDFVFPIFEQSILRTFSVRNGNFIKPNFPENLKKRTQDLPKSYIDAGQFYWGKKEAWLKNDGIIGEKSRGLIVPKYSLIDIDSKEDLEFARKIYTIALEHDNA